MSLNRRVRAYSGLRFQVTVLIVTVTTFVLCCYGVYLYLSEVNERQEILNDKMHQSIKQLATSLKIPLYNYDQQTAISIIKSTLADEDIIAVTVLENDRVIYSFEKHNGSIIKRVNKFSSVNDNLSTTIPIVYDRIKLADIRLEVTEASLNRYLSRLLAKIVYQILIVNVILIFLTLFILQKRVLNYIIHLTEVVSRMGEKRFVDAVDIDRNDEIGLLAEAFNDMSSQIKETIDGLENKNELIAQKERLLRTIAENIPNSYILLVEEDFSISYSSGQEFSKQNIDPESVTGLSVNEIFGDRSEIVKDHCLKTLKGEEQIFELYINEQYQLCKTIPLSTEDGAISRILVVVENITERKRAEALMVQTEKMMSVGGLAAGMAHEINNPLAAIIQGVQNIDRRISVSLEKNSIVAEELGIDLGDLREYLEKREVMTFLTGIKDAGLRAADIVKDMLNFSRQSDARMKMEPINSIIDETLEICSHDYDLSKKYDFKKISIVKDYGKEIETFCVKSEIQQVLLNLFKNGADIMGSREGYQATFYVRTYRKNNSVFIEIQDNGPGMDETTRKRVFEPFYTTKPVGKGTGLGLSVSYFIITQNHKGNMWVESAPDKGAKFVIELPVNIGES